MLVRVDTPQWRAWTTYRGKAPPVNREGTGWRFPSEWPPGVEGERGAAWLATKPAGDSPSSFMQRGVKWTPELGPDVKV